MTTNSPIRAYLVDLDGTLYRPGLVKLGMALELLAFGLGQVKWLRAFRHEHEVMRAEQGAVFSPNPFEAQLARAASRAQVDAARLRNVVERWMFLRPRKWLRIAKNAALLEELAGFRKQGGKTALVSDYPASQKLEALNASHLFDQVVASGETDGLKRLKPHPDGYLLAASLLGVSPSECLVIGDRDDADGAAARAAGMRFRWVR